MLALHRHASPDPRCRRWRPRDWAPPRSMVQALAPRLCAPRLESRVASEPRPPLPKASPLERAATPATPGRDWDVRADERP